MVTLWLRGSSSAVAATFSTTSAVKVAILVTILVAEAIEKGGLLLSPLQTYAPQSMRGIYATALF